MALLERKKIRTKKWSTIYIERTSNINDNEIQKKIDKEEVRDFLGGIWARTMIAKKMSKVIKHKIRQKSHSCKKSLLNLHYPIAPSDWNKHWGSQLMCSICNSPAIYDSIICNTCDTIVHITCVENNPDGDHMIIRRDETDEEDASMEYYCSYCKEHEILEKNYYNKELSRLKYERHLKQMVNRIISILKTRIDRARFLKQRQLAIALQALARRHNIRRKFHQIRRNQIRVILLDIVSLPKIDGACMIVWTVVDKFKNHQLFRMDKEINRALIEGFLIPGTSANVSIYMTIIRSEGQNLFFAGQCQIALRDVNPFEENQVHTLTVSENIEWHPQETRVEKLVFQLPIPVHAHSSTSLYSPLYHEDTQLNVLITPGTAPSTAGAVNTPGGIGEGLLGLTNSENDQQGIGNDLKVTNNDIHQQRVLTSQTSLPSNDIMASNSMTGLSIASLTATAPRMVAQIRYNAVSTVTSYCAHIQGPPLDVLRRTADHYYHNTRNKNNSAAERKTKWWICLVELNLLFYQYLGDTKPRYAVYVADANAYVPKDNVNSGSSALLLFSDKRKWLLDFETPFEAKRFVYTMNESKKAMEGTSIFFKHQKQFSAKFIIH